MTNAKVLAAVLLAILGIAMIIIGAMGSIAPPIITGVGFFVIAGVFYRDAKGSG